MNIYFFQKLTFFSRKERVFFNINFWYKDLIFLKGLWYCFRCSVYFFWKALTKLFFSLHYTETEWLYATNNEFQRADPKGFSQVKGLENDKLCAIRLSRLSTRRDPPHILLRAKACVFLSLLDDGQDGVLEYSGSASLRCDCCDITGVEATVKDGVLTIVVSRVNVKDQENMCSLTLTPFTGSIPIPSSPKITVYLCTIDFLKFSIFPVWWKVTREYSLKDQQRKEVLWWTWWKWNPWLLRILMQSWMLRLRHGNIRY